MVRSGRHLPTYLHHIFSEWSHRPLRKVEREPFGELQRELTSHELPTGLDLLSQSVYNPVSPALRD